MLRSDAKKPTLSHPKRCNSWNFSKNGWLSYLKVKIRDDCFEIIFLCGKQLASGNLLVPSRVNVVGFLWAFSESKNGFCSTNEALPDKTNWYSHPKNRFYAIHTLKQCFLCIYLDLIKYIQSCEIHETGRFD